MGAKQGYGMRCGHCHSIMRIRTSEGMSETVRVIFLQCCNELCGATYRGYAEITHQYSESGCPNPSFNLPIPDDVLRRQDQRALRQAAGDTQDDLFDCLDEHIE